MNTRDEATELGSLLRSRFPIILIESHEEPRILGRRHPPARTEG
jgi:hypothetical protein